MTIKQRILALDAAAVASTVSDYQRDMARADQQIRRKLGAAYFYLSPEEKKEYIRSYFRKFR